MNQPLHIKRSGFLRLAIETKAEAGVFEGYGSVFGNVDSHGDMVMPGAYADTLAAQKAKGRLPAMLWQHDVEKPIGRWLAMSEDSIGLHVKGRCNLDTAAGRDAFAHIRDGDVGGLSIGYRIPAGGSDESGLVRRLKTVELVEVSVVTVPANDAARIQLGSKGDLETLLAKSGLAKEAARRIAHGGWPALTSTPLTADLSPLLDALRASANRY